MHWKVYISADIEGTCGIADWSETERSTPMDYTPFQKQMTREVAAACEGILAADPRAEIYVKDAHDSARNIDPAALPESVHIIRGWTGDPLSMMTGMEQDVGLGGGTFDVALFTGYHTAASKSGNPLSHTMNLRNEYVLLNGELMSEFRMNAYTAVFCDALPGFISGDADVCMEAGRLFPGIVTVPVNEGIGGAVVSIHPEVAIRQIREGARMAMENFLRNPGQPRPTLPERFDMVVRFKDHKVAYSKSFYPGARLEDEKNVCFSATDWYEILRFSHFVLSDG